MALIERDDAIANVLRGCMDDLPTLKSQIVRIFISSTFTDTEVERNLLIENVYPNLKTYCKEKYGLEFQVVDMRWGVTDEITDDHQTTEICLREIDNCKKLSVGPNFVTFLNQRNGFKPLRANIPEKEFELFLKCLGDHEKTTQLLSTWYIKDINAIPAVYILQPISKLIPGYRHKTPESRNEWNAVLTQLQGHIKFACQKCYEEGKIEENIKHKYFMSVTEEEVDRGILREVDDISNKGLCFVRIIEDMNNHLQHPKASRFVDMTGNTIDNEAQLMLSRLRDKVGTKLTHTQRNSVYWSKNGGIHKHQHQKYLAEFEDGFRDRIRSMIDNAMASQESVTNDRIYREALHHLSMAKDRCKHFKGRENLVSTIMEYIRSNKNEPLVVLGESGSGLSSVMAEVARKIPIEFNKDAVTVLRFLGTTPKSSNICRLLHSLCSQISRNFESDSNWIPEHVDELQCHFSNLLQGVSGDRQLVLVLDSLDHLSSDRSAHKLNWIPRKLPPNVKIVLSAGESSQTLFNSLVKLVGTQDILSTQKIDDCLSRQIFKSVLASNQRTLTSGQWDLLDKAFDHCTLPLYIKIMLDEASSWKSYSPLSACRVAYTVEDSIDILFQKLEEKHGTSLFSRTMAYLTASDVGISDTEIEDILSLDDVVLRDVYQYHVPPVRRLPSLLWIRIKHDISGYLDEREVDDVLVTFWHYQQFIKVAKHKYLSDPKFSTEIHSLMADYYTGCWYGVEKPFRYTEHQMKKTNSIHPEGKADRKVAEQPIIFLHDGTDVVRYNKRKLNRVPYHLTKAHREHFLIENYLHNYVWLNAKLQATSVQELVADFQLLRKMKSPLQDILTSASSELSKYPESLAIEIAGRLLPLVTSYNGHQLSELLRQCYNTSITKCPVVSRQACYAQKNWALCYSFREPTLPYGSELLAISSDSKRVMALTTCNEIIVWDLTTGEMERKIRVLNIAEGKLDSLTICPRLDAALLNVSFHGDTNPVVLLDTVVYAVTGTTYLEKGYSRIGFKDNLKLCMTEDKLSVFCAGRGFDIFKKHTGKLEQEFSCADYEMGATEDHSYVILKQKQSTEVCIYELETLKIVGRMNTSKSPKEMTFAVHEHTSGLVLYFWDATSVSRVDLHTSVDSSNIIEIASSCIPNNIIQNVSFVSMNNWAIITTMKEFIIWDLERDSLCKKLTIPEHVKPQYKVIHFSGQLAPDNKYFLAKYEEFLIVWDVETTKAIGVVKAAHSRIKTLLIANNGEIVVTTAERDNAISVWKFDSLLTTSEHERPLSLHESVRYISSSEDGTVAAIRSNSSNEVAIIDVRKGIVTCELPKHIDVIMTPVITADGHWVLVRSHNSDNALIICDTTDGIVHTLLPISGMELREFRTSCDSQKLVVSLENENSKEARLEVFSLPEGVRLRVIWIGRYVMNQMFFCTNDEHIAFSKQDRKLDTNLGELSVYDWENGVMIMNVDCIRPEKVQPLIRNSEHIITQRPVGDHNDMAFIKIDVVQKSFRYIGNEVASSKMSISGNGKYGIDKDRQLFDLESGKLLHQFDSQQRYTSRPIQSNSPRLTTDGRFAIWLKTNEGLLKVGHISRPHITYVIPVHSVPICLEVTISNVVLLGSADGRVMMLQIVDPDSTNESVINAALRRQSGIHKLDKRKPKHRGKSASTLSIQSFTRACVLV